MFDFSSTNGMVSISLTPALTQVLCCNYVQSLALARKNGRVRFLLPFWASVYVLDLPMSIQTPQFLRYEHFPYEKSFDFSLEIWCSWVHSNFGWD
jgi:hypothetical protein